MVDDDAEARRQRAERLHKQIERVTGKKRAEQGTAPAARPGASSPEHTSEDPPDDQQSPATRPASPLSPRQFIERRMRELDDAEKRGEDPDDDA